MDSALLTRRQTATSFSREAWPSRRWRGWGLVLVWLWTLPAVHGFFLDSLFGPDPALASQCEGACQLLTTCWLTGGRVVGYCGGFFLVCCSRPLPEAEARQLTFWGEPPVAETSRLTDIQYGPVINEPHCGLPRIARRRVVGGSSAGFGQYPWQALVRIGNSRCGGALINKLNVVTAGHCVHEAKARTIRVYLGEYTLYNNLEPLPSQQFGVVDIFAHPHYHFTPQADRYDVAILRLDRPVRYQPHISPVCLPLKNQDIPEHTSGMVAGWGAMNANAVERPVSLQAVDVKVVTIFEDMMCAGHEMGGKDACQGDSGGPLMTRMDGKWYLIGIVSAGYSCAKPGQPGIYHRVTKTSDWISYTSRHVF
eukprot:maker-scaffold756_size101639-snap-gene-0.17 protein:Tk07951 transcript:maker-scaffold756_size101639-snap-gene-0.17-mRNA-1 annotation:"serine proteinase stubble"